MKKWTMINEKTFNIVSQIAFWCILQLLGAIAAQLTISNAEVTILEKSTLQSFNGIIITLAFLIIASVGLTLFYNIYLSDLTMMRFSQRPS
jgi:hypothetical protein